MRFTHRASAVLAAAGLVLGLGAAASPASAYPGNNAMRVNIVSLVPGWSVTLQCAPDWGGSAFQRQVKATPYGPVQRAVLGNLGRATCNVQATQPTLTAAGLPGTASLTGVRVTRDVLVNLVPVVASCLTCTPTPPAATTATPSTTPVPPPAPSISGKPVVGQTITANVTAPAGATITRYQWFIRRTVHGHERRILVRIKHAHHRSLRMKERLAGKHVLVGVTYTMVGAKPTTVYSQAVKVMKERMKE